MSAALVDALRKALPYVERVALTTPTQAAGIARQKQAAADLAAIRKALADVDA